MTAFPPRLKPGDRIHVPAPSSPVKEAFLAAGLERLRERGWAPSTGPNLFQTRFYSAGDDAVRAADLVRSLSDPGVAAVWPARGGYGCGRLLPALDRAFAGGPPPLKWLLGCSDVTFLLLYARRSWGWPVVHGPMPAGDMARGPRGCDLDYLFALLEGRPLRPRVSAVPLEVLREGPDVVAPLTGGCLSILAATLGTPWEWETEGCILFLEDTQVKPYQLDRLLTQLRQAGKFDRCRGIVFGRMVECSQHPGQGYTVWQALSHALAGLDVPVLGALASGHSDLPTVPLVFGPPYRLSTAESNLFLEALPDA